MGRKIKNPLIFINKRISESAYIISQILGLVNELSTTFKQKTPFDKLRGFFVKLND